jgi:hypothetical protein
MGRWREKGKSRRRTEGGVVEEDERKQGGEVKEEDEEGQEGEEEEGKGGCGEEGEQGKVRKAKNATDWFSRTRQCIYFFGYGGDQLGYKLYDPIARKSVRSYLVVFVTVKRKDKVPESIPVGVPPQRQQHDINDSSPGLADSNHHEAEEDGAEYVQDNAH